MAICLLFRQMPFNKKTSAAANCKQGSTRASTASRRRAASAGRWPTATEEVVPLQEVRQEAALEAQGEGSSRQEDDDSGENADKGAAESDTSEGRCGTPLEDVGCQQSLQRVRQEAGLAPLGEGASRHVDDDSENDSGEHTDNQAAECETSEDRWGDAAFVFGPTRAAAARDIRAGHFVSIMVDGEWKTGEVEAKLEIPQQLESDKPCVPGAQLPLIKGRAVPSLRRGCIVNVEHDGHEHEATVTDITPRAKCCRAVLVQINWPRFEPILATSYRLFKQRRWNGPVPSH